MTRLEKVNSGPSKDHLSLASSNSQEIIDLLVSSFHLHLGKLSDEAWLKSFAAAVNCSSAGCIRWSMGNPDYAVVSTYGNDTDVPADWRCWADRAISNSALRETAFIEDFIEASLDPGSRRDKNIDNPRILFGVVDWEPACIVMMMVRNDDQPEWSEFERKQILKILGYVRESVIVHKELDRRRYIGSLANDILNSSPRGMIALSDDGTIQMANTRADVMLDANDGLRRNHGKLHIRDRKVAKALAEHLANLKNMTGDGLPEMDWNMVADRPSGKQGYQVILGSLRLRNWNIESRATDRIAIIYLHDLIDTTRPTTTQLRDFYGLTAAQARVAGAIYNGKTIAEAAAELNVSINTARTHMRGIYAKTGVNTQTELISLLTSGLKTYGQHKE